MPTVARVVTALSGLAGRGTYQTRVWPFPPGIKPPDTVALSTTARVAAVGGQSCDSLAVHHSGFSLSLSWYAGTCVQLESEPSTSN